MCRLKLVLKVRSRPVALPFAEIRFAWVGDGMGAPLIGLGLDKPTEFLCAGS